MRIKVFGERNTGTNAVEQLIAINSDSFVSPGTPRTLNRRAMRLAFYIRRARIPHKYAEAVMDRVYDDVEPDRQWKHAATHFGKIASLSHTHVVFTVRHPLTWLMSLHRNPYHAVRCRPDDLHEFMQTRWQTLRRDRLGEIAVPPLVMYEHKLQSYFDLAYKLDASGITHEFIRLEDMAVAQPEIFERLKPYLDNPSEQFSPIQKSTKHRNRDLNYYRNYYGNELWRESVPESVERDFEFDSSLMSFFGYE